MKDYYSILGLENTASKEEIKKAYRKLSLKFHPDTNSGDGFFDRFFLKIKEAYDVLADDETRHFYDSNLSYPDTPNHENKIINPMIEVFQVDKNCISETDNEIIITWNCKNAKEVYLTPFKKVQLSGNRRIKFKVKDDQNYIELKLQCYGFQGQIIEKIIVIHIENKSIYERKIQELSSEKANCEKLLMNVLPKNIANDLKESGRTRPLFYLQTTVLVINFSDYAQKNRLISPIEILKELDIYLWAFDTIISKYNLEKIKTFGDIYVCVGGVPKVNKTNAIDAIDAAIEIMRFAKERKEDQSNKEKEFFNIRIGIHTGPLIAGVIGKQKYSYDIWGDTVNFAHKLGTTGEENKIQISDITFMNAKEKFFFTHNGKTDFNIWGEMDTFYVDGKVKSKRL